MEYAYSYLEYRYYQKRILCNFAYVVDPHVHKLSHDELMISSYFPADYDQILIVLQVGRRYLA